LHDRVINAQKAGAMGVIFGLPNDPYFDDPVNLSKILFYDPSKSTDLKIPSLVISRQN